MTPSGQFSAELDSQTEVNYLVNLNSDKVYNIHLLHDEKLCVMRNCDEDGNLLDLRQSKVKFSLKKPWCLLHIKTYKIEGINVDVPVCSHCSPELLTLSEMQSLETFSNPCIHTKCASYIIKDPTLMDGWLSLPEEENSDWVKIIHEKEDRRTATQHLAVSFIKGKTSVLYTVGKQTTPTCSSCSSSMCQCIRLWRKKKENESKSKNIEQSEDQTEDGAETENVQNHHYLDNLQYGHNKSKIKFPLHRCPAQKSILDQRKTQSFIMPDELIPPLTEERCAKHGNSFIDSLKCVADRVTVYHERGETVYNTKVYSRRTLECKCLLGYDGHPLLLYNMGQGHFYDYILLQKFIVSFVTTGETAYGFYQSLVTDCKCNGEKFSCSYRQFLDVTDGFQNNCEYDLIEAFTCITCGTTPRYFIGDGKCDIAPLMRKIDALNIKELSKHPDDEHVLKQGFFFLSLQT